MKIRKYIDYQEEERVDKEYYSDRVSDTAQEYQGAVQAENIIKKYHMQGISPLSTEEQMFYSSYDKNFTMEEKLNYYLEAKEDFLSLSAENRQRFNNDPKEFMTWIVNPANEKLAEEYGIFQKMEEDEGLA